MKKITAKFPSTCAELGTKIKKGETMIYDYGVRKCYSMASETAKNFEIKAQEEHEARAISDYIDAQERAAYER